MAPIRQKLAFVTNERGWLISVGFKSLKTLGGSSDQCVCALLSRNMGVTNSAKYFNISATLHTL